MTPNNCHWRISFKHGCWFDSPTHTAFHSFLSPVGIVLRCSLVTAIAVLYHTWCQLTVSLPLDMSLTTVYLCKNMILIFLCWFINLIKWTVFFFTYKQVIIRLLEMYSFKMQIWYCFFCNNSYGQLWARCRKKHTKQNYFNSLIRIYSWKNDSTNEV